MRYPKIYNQRIKTLPLLLVIDKDHFITITPAHFEIFEKFVGDKIHFYTTQKTKLLIQISLEIDSEYQRYVNNINKKIRTATDELERIENRDIALLVQNEAVFIDFLAALRPMSITLQKLLSGKFLKLYEQDRELVEDLFLSNNQLIDICSSSLKQISNIREGYSTIVSNNLNKVMKLLTSITLILTIPTIISSFYGMNVGLPYSTNPNAFWEIAGVTALISSALLILFWKKDYL